MEINSVSCSSSRAARNSQGFDMNLEGGNISREDSYKSDSFSCSESALMIRNLCKRYGSSQLVLKNLCMNVKKGTIYGLLGASGCGKTSLLKCIVGMHGWQSGKIAVFGRHRDEKENEVLGRICGYMPQDTLMLSLLTIKETIQFFGKLYNMSGKEVMDQILTLKTLLQLPSMNKLIKNLSGGETRRVSLALALLHSPQLLILDEPTVGLDLLLRQSIWNHLKGSVEKNKTTIIITTHYIEEAKLSNIMGFMRHGRLLFEDIPTKLLEGLQCELLDEAILILCRKDGDLNNNTTFKKVENSYCNPKFQSKSRKGSTENCELEGKYRMLDVFDEERKDIQHLKKFRNERSVEKVEEVKVPGIFLSLNKIQGLTTILFLTLIRHYFFVALTVLIPTIQGCFVFAVIGTQPQKLGIGVINSEVLNWTSECSTEFIPGNSCDFSFLSCKFIRQLEKNNLFQLLPFTTSEEAILQVQAGNSWGYIEFPSNFSQNTFDLVTAPLFSGNETLKGSRIPMRLDFSQYVGSLFIVKEAYLAYQQFIMQLAKSCGMDERTAQIPLYFRPNVYGVAESDTYSNDVITGSIISAVFSLVSACASLIYISDKKSGMLSRAYVGGLGTFDILISYMITQCAMGIVQAVLWTLVAVFGFGLDITGPLWVYILICILTTTCATSFGMLVGVLCAEEVEAMIVAIFLAPTFLFYGGMYWPFEAIPTYGRYFSLALPTTLSTLSLRSVVDRGLGITHPFVWPGVAINIFWTFVLATGFVICYKKLSK